MKDDLVLTQNFKEEPFWWEAWDPRESANSASIEVPAQCDVVVVGAGYAGISCAMELAQSGVSVTVVDEQAPGMGASTRNGGQVTGGVNVGKVPSGGAGSSTWIQRQIALLSEAAEAYRFFEELLARHSIDCGYHRNGRITAAWTAAHVEAWRKKIDQLNELTDAGAFVMSRELMREELASDIYAGGIFITRAGYIDPALFFGGLLDAAKRAGVSVCPYTSVRTIERKGAGFSVATSRQNIQCQHVVIATNGYTGAASPSLGKRILSVTSHQIATEQMPPALARSLIPKLRAVAETRRVINYFRMSTDGRRLLFGGRARFYRLDAKQSARVLRNQMVQRFPQLEDVKISHSWGGQVAVTFDFLPHIGLHDGIHYALGCNGSGVTMMTYLGFKVARSIVDRESLASSAYGIPLPGHPLYNGKPWFMPVVGSYYQLRDALDLRREQSASARTQ